MTTYTNDIYGMLLQIADLSGAADTYPHDNYGQILRLADTVGASAGPTYPNDMLGQLKRVAAGISAANTYPNDIYGQILRIADTVEGVTGGGGYGNDIYNQLRRVALLGGANALRGDAYGSFANMADGAPTNAATGQPFLRELVGVATTAQAVVSSGALVAPASGGASTATYTGWRLPEDIKSLYADVSFGDADDVAAIISTADVSLAAVVDSSAHIVFGYASWAIQYFSASSISTVASGTFTGVPFGARRRIGWRISGDDIYLLLPTGAEIGPYTSSAVASRANHCAIFEHFRNTTGVPGTKFYSVAANLFADPIAAGRTNLLLQRNNLANAAWTKTAVTGPTSGQADAAGGTLGEKLLETSASSIHWFRQNVAKAASPIRYTWRCKVQLIGRDWIGLACYDGGFSGQAKTSFNATTGAFGASIGTFTAKTWMLYPLGNSWFQVQGDFISNSDTALNPGLMTETGDAGDSFVGDITKGMVVYDQWLFSRPT